MNANKRFQKEIRQLYIQQSQRDLHINDYLIYYDETNINKLHTIIRGPTDSVYRHKFIRLDFMIPDNYPHSPPEVTFINYDGVRIHPNMYENGKCCATILNTWGDDKFEKWTSSMGIETILLTFHSFLDNNPYTYEPGGRDDPSYTDYVQHQSWSSCLIRYLQNETIELFTEFMHNYLLINIDSIFNDLYELSEIYPSGYYETRCFEIETFPINYSRISGLLEYYYNYIEFQESHQISSFDEFINMDYDCCICYDTTVVRQQGTLQMENNSNCYIPTNDKVNDNLYFSCCFYKHIESCKECMYKDENTCCKACYKSSAKYSYNYMNIADNIVSKIKEYVDFENSLVIFTGHSLGGTLASMMGLTYNKTAVAFESPGDKHYIDLVGLGDIHSDKIYHFGHDADPLFIGNCGMTCSSLGYYVNTKCHVGNTCSFRSKEKLGYGESILKHRIDYIINNIIPHWETDFPECVKVEDCVDCEDWTYI